MSNEMYLISALFTVLLAVFGFLGRRWDTRMTIIENDAKTKVSEERHERLVERLEKSQDKMSDRVRQVYEHQDNESQKLREEINEMSKSLRTEMRDTAKTINDQQNNNTLATNALLMKLIEGNGKNN